MVQAQAVKWMKSSIDAGGMTYNDLQVQIMSTVKMFNAQPDMIRDQVEGLIQKEFFERDETKKNWLVYLA